MDYRSFSVLLAFAVVTCLTIWILGRVKGDDADEDITLADKNQS